MKNATMRTGVLIVLFLMGLLAAPVSAENGDPETSTEVECDPYPIGRCGEYQRETVIFCYVKVNGLYVSATDDTAIGLVGTESNLGTTVGLGAVDEDQLYLRTGPAETFVDDPWSAPFPFKSVFRESNNVEGLQPTNFWCGQWAWFAECVPQQWMGPTGVISKQPDLLII